MKFNISLLAVLGAALTTVAQDIDAAEVKTAFDTAKIPTALSIKFNPTALLQVTLPQQNGSPVILKAGTRIPRASTVGPPQYKVNGTTSTGPFVIVMVDLDAPTTQSPTWSPIRHYLGGGWSATNAANPGVLSTTTAAVTAWFQPAPSGTDPHRYVFFLYNQSTQFPTQRLVTSGTSITNWNLSSFAQQVGLGDPLAGTFMLVGPQ
ncbi:phosphatidylethanolamine-binding protein [Crepidotus variabilis]|uniref:Phosphatidylethanolamine-binding protein n=1 Tax=Crepidotus variabilis TaxID=179855 RepID=A0A9P6EIP2_9AGAR|nr:phosphatidylethanolamine-binding protein [Crepidotus variabilis]